MANPVPDRKRDHSAVDQSSSAADEDDPGPMVIEAECQDESPIEWDEDEERVWKHRMKHVQVRDLALQQWIADGRLTLQKVASSANAADLLTKHVSQNVLQSLVPKLGLQQ